MLGTLIRLVASSMAITFCLVAFAGEFASGRVNQDTARRLATGEAFQTDQSDQQRLAMDHSKNKVRREDHRR